MKANKNIKFNLPEDIENVETNMMQYKTAESRCAYLKLVRSEAVKYYKSMNEENDDLSKYNLTVIDQALDELGEHLEKERKDYEPVGYKYDEDTIKIELDNFDTYEEQIDYLKSKYKEYEVDTINIYTNEFDQLGDYIKHLIKKREGLIEQYSKSIKAEEMDENKYQEKWGELVTEYFKPDFLRRQLEQIGDKKEDEYINYCVRRFRHWTIPEWMKYYERITKAEHYESLKKANLSQELEDQNTLRITNAKFEESTLGQYTLGNLNLFQEKYIDQNKYWSLSTDILKMRDDIKELLVIRNEKRVAYDNLINQLEELEKQFDNDICELPNNLGWHIKKVKSEISIKEKEINNIEKKIWGLVGDNKEGLIWKHYRLMDEYKKQMIGDKELYKELNEKSVTRRTNEIRQTIADALSKNVIKVEEDEMDELVLEVLRVRISNTEQLIEEILNPLRGEENLDNVIKFVLGQKYEVNHRNEGIDLRKTKIEKYSLFNFDFEKIKKHCEDLETKEALVYLYFVQKEFDREKRENYYLFMSKDEIEYFEQNIIVTNPEELYAQQDFTLMGIGAKKAVETENFIKNINNEIKFIKDKSRLLEKKDDKTFEEYMKSGREYYLMTWRREGIDLLSFEKLMIEKFGNEVEKYVVKIYEQIKKSTNPIEFICNTNEIKNTTDERKVKDEIKRIKGYIEEVNKIAVLTSEKNGWKEIPDEELEKLDEWQCHLTQQIKDSELRDWVEYLRKNRPGYYDTKYGETYKVDFEWVTNTAIKELTNYRDELGKILSKMARDIESTYKEKGNIVLDQDTLIEKFQKECKKRDLIKGKTIPIKILYEIATTIGMKITESESFKSGNPVYQEAREYASRFGYVRRKPRDRERDR